MHKIICIQCGHTRKVPDYIKMAPVDFICPMCGIRNGDYKIYDEFGKILIDTKARKQREQEAREFFSNAVKSMENEIHGPTHNMKETKNMAETWKYKVVFIEHPLCVTAEQDAANVERILNQYGAAGWELVHVENRDFYFKKRS